MKKKTSPELKDLVNKENEVELRIRSSKMRLEFKAFKVAKYMLVQVQMPVKNSNRHAKKKK